MLVVNTSQKRMPACGTPADRRGGLPAVFDRR